MLQLAPRKDLEDWDSNDIATNKNPTYPHLANLKTIKKGRSISHNSLSSCVAVR
jgi:hypothetical protein